MTTIPNSAEEALADGWVMVCVIPTNRLKPAGILDRIIAECKTSVEVQFTYKGGSLQLPQRALWVIPNSSEEMHRLLIQVIHEGNPVLDRFAREILSPIVSGMTLSKGPRNNYGRVNHKRFRRNEKKLGTR